MASQNAIEKGYYVPLTQSQIIRETTDEMCIRDRSHKGMLIYGVCIGLLTVIIRLFGAYPEGMSFACLLYTSRCV